MATYVGDANFAPSRSTVAQIVDREATGTVAGPTSEPAALLPQTGTTARPLTVTGLGLVLAGAFTIGIGTTIRRRRRR